MNTILPDDPRITAYALGELDGDARAEVEAAIAADGRLREAVEQVRATSAQLASALAAEAAEIEHVGAAFTPTEAGAGERRPYAAAAIIPGRNPKVLDGGEYFPRQNIFSFPRMYYVIGGLAAACFAILIAVYQPGFRTAIRGDESFAGKGTKTIEMNLVPAEPLPARAEATIVVGTEPLVSPLAVAPAMDPVRTAGQPAIPANNVVVSNSVIDSGASAPAVSLSLPVTPPIDQAQAAQGQQGQPGQPGQQGQGEVNLARSRAQLVPATGGLVGGGRGAIAGGAAAGRGGAGGGRSAAVGPETAIRLDPFQVTEQTDNSFITNSVGTGGRLVQDAKDVPAAYFSINRALIDALGITDIAEVGGRAPGQTFRDNNISGNNDGTYNRITTRGIQVDLTANSTNSSGASTGVMKNFYMNQFPSNQDSYSAETFDFGQGPNGVLYGGSQSLGQFQTTDGSRYGPRPVGRPLVIREAPGTESYAMVRPNEFTNVADEKFSTFSVDVDTASYANVRRFLLGGQLPPRDAVRIEEMVNYFPYHYTAPKGTNVPFATFIEATAAPWNSEHRLVRIGLKGREVSAASRPRANLVFLLDVSGSMDAPNKLPLVKDAMRLLVRRLNEDDRVAIVVYAGASGVALPSTSVARSNDIELAIDSLRAQGSTNGAAGIQLAYEIAQQNFIRNGVNRVILCTDGDFNVGVTSQGDLVRMIEDRAKTNVFLTVLGFGMGNLKDSTLELLADKGNGNYGYIDSRAEAEKLLVDGLTGTLVTIAKDVKIQVEFNPAQVSAYRLVGYENRMLAAQDFNNDKVDAGEIGAGHTVTALYEVVPANSGDGGSVDPSRYQSSGQAVGGRAVAASVSPDRVGASEPSPAVLRELLTVKVRYKDPTGTASRLQEFPFTEANSGSAFSRATEDVRFASAVAAFGMALRGDTTRQGALLDSAIAWAEASRGTDEGGYRSEFVDLARRARAMVR